NEINPANPLTVSAGNLYAANASVTPQLNVSVAGNSAVWGNTRTINISVNGSLVINNSSIGAMNAAVLNADVPLPLVSTTNTTFTIADNNVQPEDRIVAGFIDLSYPRVFNFDNNTNF